MRTLNRKALGLPLTAPERIVQFGGGNFLRGFAGWIVQRLNAETDFDSSIVIVKVTPGRYAELDAQDSLYHVHLEGVTAGQLVSETELISSVSRTVYPYEDFDAYLALARQPEIRFIISNTTENGIHYDAEDRFTDTPPRTFPAKLTRFLYERYQHFGGEADKGCVVLPTELIEKNGDQLRRIVLRYAEQWGLEAGFTEWLQADTLFCNTLVDRIVPGFPQDAEKAEALFAQVGYQDPCLVVGEPYHSWVIEGPDKLKALFPVAETDLNVIITADAAPYQQTKVRILNGMHTGMVALGYFAGLETVKDVAENPVFMAFLRQMVYEEIIPSMDLPAADLQQFAESAFDRLANPSIQHRLASIALNSVAKYRARLLPSLLAYQEKRGAIPPCIALTLAALLRFYAGEWQGEPIPIQDEAEVVRWFAEAWQDRLSLEAFVRASLAQADFWGQNLTHIEGLADAVAEKLYLLETQGVLPCLQEGE
jgi:tagaturonate reductase